MNETGLIEKLFKDLTGSTPNKITSIPRSGSDRKYYILSGAEKSVVAVINPNREENDAFIYFTNHFKSKGLNVPEILKYYPDDYIYFQTYLGDTNLFTWLDSKRPADGFNDEILSMYKLVLDNLIDFQTGAIEGLDLDMCYPHKSFDEQSMIWDMNYFKYMFLKLVSVPFNEKRLEKDFESLKGALLSAGRDYFLYRDFQSANIMIVDAKPWFIDYQGGRSGAPQYDIASILYDSKAQIPQQSREILLEYYIDKFCNATGYNENLFRETYPAFGVVRIMQALGAYGYRGLFEQKPGFVQSIIPAVRDINNILESGSVSSELPELKAIMVAVSATRKFEMLKQPESFRVLLTSFSYMNGVPHDAIHGGGYIFDCRGLINPGKESRLVNLTGLDREVSDFMSTNQDVIDFIDDAFSMVKRSVESYKKKNYTSLAVSFGCTGGKHRSVYSATKMAEKLKKIDGIDIQLVHKDINN